MRYRFLRLDTRSRDRYTIRTLDVEREGGQIKGVERGNGLLCLSLRVRGAVCQGELQEVVLINGILLVQHERQRMVLQTCLRTGEGHSHIDYLFNGVHQVVSTLGTPNVDIYIAIRAVLALDDDLRIAVAEVVIAEELDLVAAGAVGGLEALVVDQCALAEIGGCSCLLPNHRLPPASGCHRS